MAFWDSWLGSSDSGGGYDLGGLTDEQLNSQNAAYLQSLGYSADDANQMLQDIANATVSGSFNTGGGWLDSLFSGLGRVGSSIGGGGTSGGSSGGALGGSSNLGALLALAGGGLLGNLSGARQTGEQTVKSVPWDLQQPYLLDTFDKGKALAGVTPTNSYMDTALANAQGAVSSPLAGQAQSAVSGIIGQDPAHTFGIGWKNPYSGQNPYLQQAIDSAQGDVTRQYNLTVRPQWDSAMRASGSFGNTGIQQMQQESQRQLAGELGRISSGMRMQDYGTQQQLAENQAGRDNQMYQFGANTRANATFNAPQFSNQQLAGNASLFGLGQQAWQNQFTPTLNYGQMVHGSYGDTKTSPIFGNPWGETLGGMSTAAGIYGKLFGKQGG